MNDNLRQRAEERADKKIKFMKDLSAYVFVNMILAIINWLFSPDFWWVLFPVVFWGIGIFVNFLKTYVFDGYYGNSYRERKIEEEMKKLSD